MKRINVTKTFLPPLKEYTAYMEKIWDSSQLTNQGPLLKEFERKTSEYLQISSGFHFVGNGTLALQLALRALDIGEGEIITTPFTYVATSSAILWERCTPIYVDIDPKTFCIDAEKLEAAITPQTRAILAVHVFGNACDVQAIDAIAKKHGLSVVYDAAHAFGVEYKSKSLLSYGDVSICSFHATKPFHTIEGGAVITKHDDISEKLELMKRFGHNNDDHRMLGINAKATEFQAAMGLCNLKYIDEIIQKRKAVFDTYTELLSDKLQKPKIQADTKYNYSYYPVVFNSSRQLNKVVEALEAENIFARRYFYPSLNTLDYIEGANQCLISESIAERVLCLPIYETLSDEKVTLISRIVNQL